MPLFTPPTIKQGLTDKDPFFGRYKIDVGQSVFLNLQTGHFYLNPYPWLGDIIIPGAPDANGNQYDNFDKTTMQEGVNYFLGGRTYTISTAVAEALQADGFIVTWIPGFGIDSFGDAPFGA